MLRLALRLSLHSGREALVRLVVTTAAVAVGVAILLAVLADFHAFQVTNNRPFWEGTGSTQNGQLNEPTSNVELWHYSNDIFKGQTIERLDVAALGPKAPVPPGIARLSGSGQYYASPALAALLRATPPDELGDRFPGSLVGTIGERALTGPDELVIFVGYSPVQLAALPGTFRVSTIATASGEASLVTVFPRCVCRQRPGVLAPDPHTDRYGHAASRRPSRGTLCSAAAGGGHSSPDQCHRLG
jgi:hypothetical protein